MRRLLMPALLFVIAALPFAHAAPHAKPAVIEAANTDNRAEQVAKHYVVLVSIGEEAVLTALALSRAKLGLVFLEMKRTANELSNLV